VYQSCGVTVRPALYWLGATIEGTVCVNDVLLDTGSDVTIVSKGVFDVLTSAGVAVEVKEK
jgi:hypothetical protein